MRRGRAERIREPDRNAARRGIMCAQAYRASVVRMLDDLNEADRMRLMKFVCSFAWADLEVRDEERAFASRLMRRLGLAQAEMAQVEQWLIVPPRPESVDPTDIPAEHRRVFVETMEGLIEADGEVHPEEAESLSVFRKLLV